MINVEVRRKSAKKNNSAMSPMGAVGRVNEANSALSAKYAERAGEAEVARTLLANSVKIGEAVLEYANGVLNLRKDEGGVATLAVTGDVVAQSTGSVPASEMAIGGGVLTVKDGSLMFTINGKKYKLSMAEVTDWAEPAEPSTGEAEVAPPLTEV